MQRVVLGPSAPVLDDEDEGLVSAVRRGPGGGSAGVGGARPVSEVLPGYER